MDTENQLRELILSLEQQLSHAACRQDPGMMSELLDDNFVEFGASGRRFDKTEIMALLKSDSEFIPYDIQDFTIKKLAGDSLLATYAIPTRQTKHGDIKPGSRRSSVWRYKDNRWQLLFHQGTWTDRQ